AQCAVSARRSRARCVRRAAACCLSNLPFEQRGHEQRGQEIAPADQVAKLVIRAVVGGPVRAQDIAGFILDLNVLPGLLSVSEEVAFAVLEPFHFVTPWFVFLFRCRRGQLFVSLNSYTIRAILVLVRVWGLGSAPSVPLHTPLGFMPEPVWQKRSANRHRRSAKFGAVY